MVVRTVRVVLRRGEQDRWLDEMRAWGDRMELFADGLVWATVGLTAAPEGCVGMVTSVWTSRSAMLARVSDPPRPVWQTEDAVVSWTVDVVEAVGAWSTDAIGAGGTPLLRPMMGEPA